jgi:WD40 repeat protein
MSERTIFVAALEKSTPEQRSAFLDEACAGDAALRERTEALLRSHEQGGSFLGQPVPERVAAALAKPEGAAETQGEPPDPDVAREVLPFLTPSDKPDVLGRLGHYDIVEVIGKGGMGIVLRAFDEKLHRVVAIKVMAAQLATSASARKRFTREAQAAAAVSHDHVVTIHAVEEANGLPYLVMQYVLGLSLQERLDRSGPLQLAEIVRIGMQTAAGLAAAHAQGLVHRDIKPANILLENGIERVKITDFGLARAAADASVTQSGVVAGTPQYMSPEQARGERPDARSDLFSLGSVLYALCTGRPPFRAGDSMAVLKRVCDETPRPIRETNADIPDWLVALIDRLHAKDPADRYQSAAEVATLLSGHLAHLQHPSLVPLPAGATKRQPKQHRRRWAIACAMLICLVIGFSLLEATGVTRLRATVIGVFTADGPDAGATNGGGKPGNGGEATGLDFKVGEVRKHHWAGRRAYFAGFSPDGRYYVATGDAGGSGPETVRVWDLASGKLVMEVTGNEFAFFMPDSKRLIAAGPDRQIHVWDLATRQQIAQFGEHPNWVRLSSLSVDGKQLLTGCNDGIVRLWDVAEGKEIARLESEGKLGFPYFCPDRKQAITVDFPMNIIRLWDLAHRKEIRRWQQPDHPLHEHGHLAFLPGGQRFVTAGPDAVYFWDMAAQKETQSLRLVGKMAGIAFSPDGSRLLYAAANDPVLRLVELPGGKELATFEMMSNGADMSFGIAFSPDGRFAVAAYLAGVVHLWRLPDPPAVEMK